MHCKNHQRGTESPVGIVNIPTVVVVDIAITGHIKRIVLAAARRAKVKNFLV